MKKIALFICGILLCGCGQQKQRFRMPTGAMIPTISENGYVIADTSASEISKLQRWDMVVYKAPETVRLYGSDAKTLPLYVMRVVGLPGETIDYGGSHILIEGKEITLPTSLEGLKYSGLSEFPPIAIRMKGTSLKLGSEEYFILGDRTTTAIDSRFLGPLPKANIVAKVIRVEKP
jgi:signal peptidase I